MMDFFTILTGFLIILVIRTISTLMKFLTDLKSFYYLTFLRKIISLIWGFETYFF